MRENPYAGFHFDPAPNPMLPALISAAVDAVAALAVALCAAAWCLVSHLPGVVQ